MERRIERAAIVGATGPTGRALATELARAGARVRAVSRSVERLEASFGEQGVEWRAADARDQRALRAAIGDAEVVFDCVGMSPGGGDAFREHARGLAAVLREAGARCVQVSSFWSYAPLTDERIDETHPRRGGPEPVRARRDAENVLADAGAAIAQLPDFHGPWVHTSTIQNPLRDAAAGRTTNWIGSLDAARECAFVPDAMRVVAALGATDAARGERWLVPGAGAITPRRVCEIAGWHLGREVRARGAGALVLRTMALFSKELRGFLPMLPTYLRPLSFEAAKLRALLEEVTVTPHEEAIPATLDAIAAESR